MTLLGPRSTRPELLDAPTHEPAELADSLRQVAAVDRWIGGASAVRRALKPLLDRAGTRLLDVGTGNATVLRELVGWAAKRGGSWKGIGVDVHRQTLSAARAEGAGAPDVELVQADGLRLPLADQSVDAALATLTLHHFRDDDATLLLREMARVSRSLVIVNDLERCLPAWMGARILAATWWRRNRLTRHDGPISVLRSFTADELARLGRSAGLGQVRVRRVFPFRLVLTGVPT